MHRLVLVLACALLTGVVGVARAADGGDEGTTVEAVDSVAVAAKMDLAVRARAHQPGRQTHSRVILRTVDGRPASQLIQSVHGIAGRYFPWLGGQVAIVPNAALDDLASRPEIAAVSLDRPVRGTMDRITTATGARWVAEHLGVTGSGIGVATVDSGVNPWH